MNQSDLAQKLLAFHRVVANLPGDGRKAAYLNLLALAVREPSPALELPSVLRLAITEYDFGSEARALASQLLVDLIGAVDPALQAKCAQTFAAADIAPSAKTAVAENPNFDPDVLAGDMKVSAQHVRRSIFGQSAILKVAQCVAWNDQPAFAAAWLEFLDLVAEGPVEEHQLYALVDMPFTPERVAAMTKGLTEGGARIK